MPERGIYRVTYDRPTGQWLIPRDGYPGTLAKYGTRSGAIGLAKRIAGTYLPSKLVVHLLDGHVEEEMSFELARAAAPAQKGEKPAGWMKVTHKEQPVVEEGRPSAEQPPGDGR